MVIRTVYSLALYCSRCGKIHVHDVSAFTVKNAQSRELVCSCGQVQATITGVGHGQYLLKIPCVVCEVNHIICLDSKQLWRKHIDKMQVQKIYCPNETVELGFMGEREAVEQMIAGNQREFERLLREKTDDDIDSYDSYDENIENPQILFDVLNKIHDIAEKGHIYCLCGSVDIEAVVLPDCIELQCQHCGGRQAISAATDKDLQQAEQLELIELIPSKCSRHNQ